LKTFNSSLWSALPSNKGAVPIPDLVEIERRFLVDGREEKPWRAGSTALTIEQHYGVEKHIRSTSRTLSCDGVFLAEFTPEQHAVWERMEIKIGRLRRQDTVWMLTFKFRLDVSVALELEWELHPDAASALLAHGPYPSVKKTRYVWRGVDGHAWEVDEFEGALAGIVLAEVELDAVNESLTLPPWVGHEITGLVSWSNRALAETLATTTNMHEPRPE